MTRMTIWALMALAAAVSVGFSRSAHAAEAPLRVVPEVDFGRYAGRWYEIARLPNWFEKSCASHVTAEYAPRPDGRITVTNRCRESNGRMKEAVGVARRVDGQPPSVLKVRFAPGVLTWLPMVWGDYQIIVLAPDYSHAVIGTPDRRYLWILARTPQLEPEIYAKLVDDARAQNFNVSALLKVTQVTP